jgi:hypothetical protein
MAQCICLARPNVSHALILHPRRRKAQVRNTLVEYSKEGGRAGKMETAEARKGDQGEFWPAQNPYNIADQFRVARDLKVGNS